MCSKQLFAVMAGNPYREDLSALPGRSTETHRREIRKAGSQAALEQRSAGLAHMPREVTHQGRITRRAQARQDLVR